MHIIFKDPLIDCASKIHGFKTLCSTTMAFHAFFRAQHPHICENIQLMPIEMEATERKVASIKPYAPLVYMIQQRNNLRDAVM